jgi:hypothetical protein
MSAETPALVRSFKVGSRTVTFTIPKPVPGEGLCASVEWDPALSQHGLSDHELDQYRAGRDAVYHELSRMMGLKIMLVET